MAPTELREVLPFTTNAADAVEALAQAQTQTRDRRPSTGSSSRSATPDRRSRRYTTEIEKLAAKVSPGGTKVSSGPAVISALVGAVIGSIATASRSGGE